MRKIIVLSMVSLDGVIQAPGGPEEDTSNGFALGGWVAPLGDEVLNNVVKQELQPADYMLGRKTFEIWENYWPHHGQFWPGINEGTKYVLSKTRTHSDWEHSVFVQMIDEIKEIKNGEGPDLHVWGSSELVHLLLANDLIDEMRLKIYPVLLGGGKKLFADGSVAASFDLVESLVTGKGVFIAHYKKAGEVRTGRAGAS